MAINLVAVALVFSTGLLACGQESTTGGNKSKKFFYARPALVNPEKPAVQYLPPVPEVNPAPAPETIMKVPSPPMPVSYPRQDQIRAKPNVQPLFQQPKTNTFPARKVPVSKPQAQLPVIHQPGITTIPKQPQPKLPVITKQPEPKLPVITKQPEPKLSVITKQSQPPVIAPRPMTPKVQPKPMVPVRPPVKVVQPKPQPLVLPPVKNVTKPRPQPPKMPVVQNPTLHKPHKVFSPPAATVNTFVQTNQKPSPRKGNLRLIQYQSNNQQDQDLEAALGTDINLIPGPERLFRLESEEALQERIKNEIVAIKDGPTQVNFPKEEALSQEYYQGRHFVGPNGPLSDVVEPNYVCYQRLRFEQPNFERYGWDLGVLQPAVCAGKFYWDCFWLPYHVGTEPWRHYECNAGYCLPGDPVPLLAYPPRLSATGALAQATAFGTGFALFP